jgi:hypothetical protein
MATLGGGKEKPGKSGRSGKGGGGNAPSSRDHRDEPYIMDEVLEIVRSAKRAHLGLLLNHDGEVIYISAWDYHAGLRKGKHVADYDFESVPVNPIYHHQLPRVALVSAQFSDYMKAVEDGIWGYKPQRDSWARSEREPSLRPRKRITVANPYKANLTRAGIPRNHHGFILLDLRSIVMGHDVRVAGTPSCYPSFFVFASEWNHDEKIAPVIPKTCIYGWHDHEVGDLMGDAGLLPQRLFSYLRYNAELTREGLDALGLPEIIPADVQKLDSVAHIDDLRRVGRAVANDLSPDHFTGFLVATT